jgi:O-antigen/teichoic acid export membrane protein
MKADPSILRGESRFLPNTAALIAQTIFAIFVTFLQVKILAAFLSKETFGLFASLRGLSLLVATLAANGFPQLLIRFLPEFESMHRRRAAVYLYGLSILASCVLLLAGLSLLGGLKTTFFDFMPSSTLSGELFFWLCVTTCGWMLKLLMYGGLNGMRRLTIHAVLDITALVAQLVWIFLERHQLDLTRLFQITGVVSIAEALTGCLLILALLVRGGAQGSVGGASQGAAGDGARRYASYWGWAVGLSVVAIAFSDVDRYLLSQVIALEMLALFHIASRVARLANRLLGVPNFAFQPEVTRLQTEGRSARTIESTRVFMKFSAAVSIFVASLVIAFTGEIITIVANSTYMGAASLLMIFAFSMPFSAITAPLTSVMKASDRVRGALYCDLLWAVAYVCLLIALSYRLGIIGAGLAQLFACVSQLLLATRLSRLPMRTAFALDLLLRLVVCAAVSFAPLFAVEIIFGWTWLDELSLVKLALLVFAVPAFKKMLVVMKVVTAEERRTLLGMLSNKGLRRAAAFIIGGTKL